jgi:hypothetical protein
VYTWAHDGRQVPFEALMLHLHSEELRAVLRREIEDLVSNGMPDGQTAWTRVQGIEGWERVCSMFKSLVGTHLISDVQRTRAKLTRRLYTQAGGVHLSDVHM